MRAAKKTIGDILTYQEGVALNGNLQRIVWMNVQLATKLNRNHDTTKLIDLTD